MLLFRGRVMVRFWVSVLGVGGKVRVGLGLGLRFA